MKTSCKFYSFLRAVRGNWRNAIFVSCGCDACMYGREVEPTECSAVLSRRSFDAAFSKYIEWHAPDPSACTLRQLCLDPSCSQNS